MIGRILFAVVFLAAVPIMTFPASAKTCQGAGTWCLFTDGHSCSIECGKGQCCSSEDAWCVFGFGMHAYCACTDCPEEIGEEVPFSQ